MPSFSSLKLKTNETNKKVNVGENEITVAQYLPLAKKVELIEFVIENSIDEANFTFSPIRFETYFALGLVKYYTDITFTEKQLFDNVTKTYDVFESNGLFYNIFQVIPDNEINFIEECLRKTKRDITTYNNSLAGMLNNISQHTDDKINSTSALLEQLKNKEGLEFLNEIMKEYV